MSELSIASRPSFEFYGNKMCIYIKITFPCNIYPLLPHFYIAKLGYKGVYLFSLFLLQNIDCGYSLEPPRRGGSNECPQFMFGAKISEFYLPKIFIFYNFKNLCILNGSVFIMNEIIS